jgi:hypothetical protein
VIVHDLQTGSKEYFICENWLSLIHGDGQIMRNLGVCGEKQKKDFKYLLKKQSQNNLSDSHLWFSILARPIHSNFTRLDRLTCCFVLLCISMLVNILYYSIVSSDSTSNGLQIGPFFLSQEQVDYFCDFKFIFKKSI